MNHAHCSHSIDISEDDGIRYLHFGSDWIQGAMRIHRPWSLELDYTRQMMACLLLHDAPWPERVLLIGLGAGSLTKFIWRHIPEAKITVIEINPRVPMAARQFFRLPEEDDRFEIRIGDGAELIACDRAHYDLILVDGFDHAARVGKLDDPVFYQHCRDRLSHNGVFVTNLFGRKRGFRASIERIAQAFDGRCLALPACESGNTISIAATGKKLVVPLGELERRTSALKQKTRLDLTPLIKRLQSTNVLPDGCLLL